MLHYCTSELTGPRIQPCLRFCTKRTKRNSIFDSIAIEPSRRKWCFSIMELQKHYSKANMTAAAVAQFHN